MNSYADTVNHWLTLRAPESHLDEEGMALLSAEDQTVIALQVPENSDVCYFYAPVRPVSADLPEADLYFALELNRFGRPLGSCWLAWDPEFAMLTLCHNLHIPSSDAISFSNTVDNFFHSLREARHRLNLRQTETIT